MNVKCLCLFAGAVIGVAAAALIIAAAPALASDCTLADHIRSANTNTAVGFCPAGTSHDVITIGDDITLDEPLPAIIGTITIEGGGHTISGDGQFPIFVVRGGRVTINNLTLTDGYGMGSRETSWVGAGALQIFSGADVVINNSVFTNNRSGRGHGGAIAVDQSQLTVNSSSFVNNRSAGQGGAIYVWTSRASIDGSSFTRNIASGGHSGGGVYTGFRSTLEITNSTFSRNHAYEGGAVGTDYTGEGPASTQLAHVTMIDNTASRGQSVYVHERDTSFHLRNSILDDLVSESCHGRLNSNIGNLIRDGSCAPALRGEPRVAEMTGSLAHFPLLDGSPALDAADARYCPETDQLGTPRPQGGGCDIGAIESKTARPAAAAVVPPPACPLNQRIIAANTDAPAGGCPAGSGHDVITLTADIDLEAPLPPITSEITIDGNGFVIRGNGRFGIIEVDGGALKIINVTLTEGDGSRGGAIRLRNGARVTATGVNFSDNSATRGGAISTESENDKLSVANSSFVANEAREFGAAILAEGGSVVVSSSAFLNNRAAELGGAVAAMRGSLAMANSTLNGNVAKKGGGIYVNGGEASLTHLTLMNNEAERIVGAGIYAEAGTLDLRNSLVAGSGNGDDCSGGINQMRGNFSQDGSCAAAAGGDPMLGDLVGWPAYHPLLDASPAHGAADPAFCPPTDQLGNQRPHCDIGAVESARESNITAAPAASPPSDCSLADQIIAANTDAPAGSCPAGDGLDTIVLRRDITLGEPLPPITSDITISGKDHTISGNHRMSIFDIESGSVVIKNMSLVNGSNDEGNGGAISLRNSARLTVVNVNFRNNMARNGGAIASGDTSHLAVFDSFFVDSVAELKGGAIWNNGSCGSIDNNQFRRSRAGSEWRSQTDSGLRIEIHLDGAADQCTPVITNTFSD